ncbi:MULTISPECIES: GntR family transcriptional regulator [Fusobacterium]|uniref:GntR family transcriptional regulator n=1 Tax=Fusobacterium hominis TaxID=2764326 RepID=A0A7G9GYR4_9FUSO|nr:MULTISPECIES: GntR family transcriptional regulator [Fusobacterium]QNM15946.1 GntR family transcriptional regulator [Fusobacterium hominis]
MIIKKGKSIREKVYDILKEMIIDGKISPGERIIETDYCEKFQISRTPLREAIRMLELEGLVESQNTGGVLVKKVTKQEIYEIYKIRIALESIILDEAIKNITDKDIKRIEEILKDTEEALEVKKDEKVFSLFSEFNNMLYDIAKLPKVTSLINNINTYMKRFRKLSVKDELRKRMAFEDHVELLRAIKDKNLIKASEINKEHLEKSMNFILSQFNATEK